MQILREQSKVPDKLHSLLEEKIGKIGKNPEGGYTRIVFSPEESLAIDTLRAYGLEAGLHPVSDQFGNLLLFLDEEEKKYFSKGKLKGLVLAGSHIDTVYNGGNYDGALGSVAAVVALESLKMEGIRPTRPTAAIIFRGEESSRFGQAYLGSKAFLHGFTHDELQLGEVSSRRPMQEIMEEQGYKVKGGIEKAIDLERIHRFFEAHIEQGPVLEDRGTQVGLVRNIRGNQRYDLVILGNSGHSGTYPMDSRQDALVAYRDLDLTRKVNELGMERKENATATIGYLTVIEGATNKVPGKVFATPEVRADTDDERDLMAKEVISMVFPKGFEMDGKTYHFEDRETGFIYRLIPKPPTASLQTNPEIVKEMLSDVTSIGLEAMEMNSGAGHDAAQFSQKAGLFFVPGRITHHPKEYLSEGALLNAYRLYKALLTK